MKIKPAVSHTFDIEVEGGETLRMKLGGENAVIIAVKEDEGSITLDLLDEAILTDGGPDEVRDAGKIRRFAKMTFNLEQKE